MAECGYAFVHGCVGWGELLDGADAARTGWPGQKSCAELMAAIDFSATGLGRRDDWDPAIAATVELVLASPMPMAFSCGDDFVLLYNDAYADLVGALHPAALGRPAAEAFGDLWLTPKDPGSPRRPKDQASVAAQPSVA